MPTSLKVIALISGGKDSLFAILHCLANGHTIVAIANLHPPLLPDSIEAEEDLNSYMYQTVGHTVIPLYEEALGIPLFRQEIAGSAVNTNRDYSAPQDGEDETESLIPLLQKVKKTIPEANAISTGAILSTYQRTRVESIALRLGLTPLSYLWQYPYLPPYSQAGLLHDMAAVGQDARIIKVASGGLDQTFLWDNVASVKTITRLAKAMARFGENGDGAVLGEGGEFETLAIDGPEVLWKKRIDVEPDGVTVGEGGNAIFKGRNARVIDRAIGIDKGLGTLRIPGLWDVEFLKIFETLSDPSSSSMDRAHEHQDLGSRVQASTFPSDKLSATYSTLTISNLVSPNRSESNHSASLQMKQLRDNLKATLQAYSINEQCILHVTLLLRNMADFTLVNSAYKELFTSPNPPSRVTVACGDRMPEDIDVMLSTIIWKYGDSKPDLSKRNGLHVQSQSYWAPANIGPYSQAINVPLSSTSTYDDGGEQGQNPKIVHVAGQIPLVPASMDLYEEEGFKGQTVLSLQHLWRIGRAMDIQWWTAGVAYISDCSAAEARKRVHTAQAAWKAIHTHYLDNSSLGSDDEDDQDIDPWDLKNRASSMKIFNDITQRSPIPDPEAVVSLQKIASPCFVVQVSALPRNASIEWHSTGLAKCRVSTEPGYIEVGNTRFLSLEIRANETIDNVHSRLGELEGNLKWVCEHSTLYASPRLEGGQLGNGWQWVPCQRVWGSDSREIEGVLVARIVSS